LKLGFVVIDLFLSLKCIHFTSNQILIEFTIHYCSTIAACRHLFLMMLWQDFWNYITQLCCVFVFATLDIYSFQTK
jgi:hypothetical protein